MRGAALAAAAFGMAATVAGTALAGPHSVDVFVHEAGGGALRDEEVFLVRYADGTTLQLPPGRGPRWEKTGANGHVLFVDLAPDLYVVGVPKPSDPGLLTPSVDPLMSYTPVVVRADDDVVKCDVEIPRGTMLRCRVAVNDDDWRAAHVTLFHVETAVRGRLVLQPTQLEQSLLMTAGTWRATIEPWPGYVVTAVTRDDWPLDGCEVALDVTEPGPAVEAKWTLESIAHADGRVTIEHGGCGQVVADVLVPGPKLAAAIARGCNVAMKIPATVDSRSCRWEMVLPDGTWRLHPSLGPDDVGEPPFVDVTIVGGERVREDFLVHPAEKEPEEEEETFDLRVRVTDPEGRPLDGAMVSAWPDGDGGGALQAPASTSRGIANFSKLASQPLHVVASHPAWLEGDARSSTWEIPRKAGLSPEALEAKTVTVVLGRGARVRVVAHGEEDGDAEPGVRVSLEALADAPPPLTVLAGTEDRWHWRAAVTDGDGKAVIAALWDGPVRLSGWLAGNRWSRTLVQARIGDGEWQRALPVTLAPDQTVDVELRVVPAASATLELSCNTDGSMPPIADVRVVEPTSGDERPASADDAVARAVIARNGVPLGGEHRDTLKIGPLEEGPWWVAVRPYGFPRWTWAPGKEAFADAMQVPLDLREPPLVQPVVVECAPRLRLVPRVATGAPVPDLRSATVGGWWSPHDLERLHFGEGRKLTATRNESDVDLRGARQGQGSVEITVEHPHFLPDAPIVIRSEVNLRHGAIRDVSLPIADVGGSIEVRADAGHVRATTPEGDERLADVRAGSALLAHLPAGPWLVDLCADAECEQPLSHWDVTVEPARSTLLPPPAPP